MRNRKLLLPDERHYIIIYEYERSVVCSILDSVDVRTKEEFTVKKVCSQWSDLVHQFCELARKKYPRQLRHKSISVSRQRIGL